MSAPKPSWPINYAEEAPAKPNQLWNILGRGEGGLRGKRALLRSKEPPPPLIQRAREDSVDANSPAASDSAVVQGDPHPEVTQEQQKEEPDSKAQSPPKPERQDEFIPLAKPDEEEAPDTSASPPSDGVVTERPIWARSVAYHDTFHLALHQEILDFVRYVTPTDAERGVRAALLERLQGVTARVFPKAETQVFGSYATDLYLPTSDIDVCVMGSGESQRDALRRLGSALRQHGFERVQCIDNAKVPIVKCVDSNSGISVDVSFDVSNGPENVALIQDYLRRYPALRPLVLVLKCFLLQRKLNEVFSGGIGSYCLILVVMSHLQMYGSNFRRSPDQKPSLGTLLIDLLHLYGKLFNYTNVGLAPRGRGSYFSKVRLLSQSEDTGRVIWSSLTWFVVGLLVCLLCIISGRTWLEAAESSSPPQCRRSTRLR